MKIYVDGGSRGNPGPSAAAYVIKNGAKFVSWNGVYLGNDKTNNFAEYQAIRLGLLKAIELDIRIVEIFSDSQLVVEQLNNRWKTKSPSIVKQINEINELLTNFSSFKISYISRENNQIADFLVNITLNSVAEQ